MGNHKNWEEVISDGTRTAQTNLDNHLNNKVGDYQESQNVQDAYKNYTDTQNAKPGDYNSKYQGAIDTILNRIQNKKPFSYDFNADPLYQQYKEQYANLGKQAMLDTTSQAAALSGGYGNSYGATAGSQAYQAYLGKLNDIIPDLYGQALDKYNTDLTNMYNEYSALGQAEDRAYGQYQDRYQNWQNDTSNALNAYNILHGNDFGEYQQRVSNWQNDRDYLFNALQNSQTNDKYLNDYNYQVDRDNVADDQWQQQFDYQKLRDQVADDQWAKEFALSQARAAKSGSKKSSGKSSSSSSGKGTNPAKSGTISSDYYNYLKGQAASQGSSYADSLYKAGIIDEGIWNQLYDDLGFDAPTARNATSTLAGGSSTPSLSGFLNNKKKKK